jgi:hypothetical protein
MQKYTYSALALAATLALSACGGGYDDTYTPPPAAQPAPPPTPVASVINIDFTKGIDGWTPGVADYYDDDEPSETGYGWSKLPAPLQGRGYFLTVHNNSDDVLTYVKHQQGGFVPGARYNLSFSMTYATDAATGCFGAGGARGDAIYMVASASGEEPKTVKQADGHYRLNLDRGNNAEEGPQGKVLGTIGIDGLSCDGGAWGQATRSSTATIPVTADKDGKLWIVLGADSGFEATNAWFLLGATVNVKPQ